MFNEWGPHVVIYEAPYQGRMKNTFGILSRYVGVIEAAHYEHYEREVAKSEAVPAHLVKRAIGAKKGKDHESNKKIVLMLVNQTFGLSLKYKANDSTKKVSQDDEADAIALNWAWHSLNRRAGYDPEGS
jgi:Holliday junction resolvasome RuvABC endonuclease subunit